MIALRLAAAAALLGVVGCSDLDPANETYEARFNLQPELPQRWACLDNPSDTPAVPPTPPAVPTYTAYVPDYRTGQAVPGLGARACLINDFECEPGASQGILIPPRAPQTPPGFTVGISPLFEGFIRLSAEGYVPLDYYILGPISQNIQLTQPLPMVSFSSVATFITGIGADPNVSLGLGILAAQVFDCNGDAAPEVTLVLPDRASQPSLQSALPYATNDRIPIANRPTDNEGIAGFINLPTVNLTVEAEVQGRRFGQRSFPIRAGRLTSGTIRPNYDVGY